MPYVAAANALRIIDGGNEGEQNFRTLHSVIGKIASADEAGILEPPPPEAYSGLVQRAAEEFVKPPDHELNMSRSMFYGTQAKALQTLLNAVIKHGGRSSPLE